MTVGELAKMIKGEGWINQAANLQLSVISVAHYTRTSRYSLPVPIVKGNINALKYGAPTEIAPKPSSS